jgi:hypothetical protein
MDTWLLDKVFCKTWGSVLKIIIHCSRGDKYENCIDLIATISIFDFGIVPSVVFIFHFIIYIKLKIQILLLTYVTIVEKALVCVQIFKLFTLKKIIYEMNILSEMIRNYKYQCNVLLLHQRPPSNTCSPFNNLQTV